MIRIATRHSPLALVQARQVAALLGGGEIVEVSSGGAVGDKGRFVRGVEEALLEGRADLGVHSAKDLPGVMTEGLVIAAVPAREDARDVWVGAVAEDSEDHSNPNPTSAAGQDGSPSLTRVPRGARVGTASLRRRAQLLAARPDLEVVAVRGNVDTRLAKLAAGEVDALVLAAAGLRRLGREGEIGFAIPAEEMVPAPGQGALVAQARKGDEEAIAAAAAIGDETARRELTAERAVVAQLGASCDTPIGVRARIGEQESGRAGGKSGGDGSRSGGDLGEAMRIEAFVGLPDGSEWIRDRVKVGSVAGSTGSGGVDAAGDSADPAALGALLAERLLLAGARDLLDRAEAMA